MGYRNTASVHHPKRRLNVVTAGVFTDRAAGASKLRQLELSESLSKLLDLTALVNTFAHAIQADIPHDGFQYQNDQLQLSLDNGKGSRHRLEYQFRLGDQALGELTLMRSRVFASREVALIEDSLCSLVYPLRNAVMYQLALQSAFRDPLTGAHNRAALENTLPREIRLARRHEMPFSLLVVDIDHFKEINDSHGHQVGDTVLRELVGTFSLCIRSTDLVFRYGGDEFVIALSNTDKRGAHGVAERIRAHVEKCNVTSGNVRLVLSTSIGVTDLNHDDTPETLFRRADEALFFAKRAGRNQVAVV
jgi:diguanylate cyclase (GGDEF)-like protein